MANIFSRFKDTLIDLAASSINYNLLFPLQKTGEIINNYTRGDFIVIGGRKTSGKASFILNNYVISPLIQKISAKKNGTPFEVRVVYINTRRSAKSVIERMIVNYVSQKNSGSKISVPSLYGYRGKHKTLTKAASKNMISSTMGVFSQLTDAGVFTLVSTSKTILEIENTIRTVMDEYGELDEETNIFTYAEKYKELIPIISIDDTSGIYGDDSSTGSRVDVGHVIGRKLKTLAKVYGAVITLAVPSATLFKRTSAVHNSSVDEIFPFNIYADRAIFLHNPLETEDLQVLGYHVSDFVNASTGVCYLRTAFVATNYMGGSSIYIPYFMYPENGFFRELPPADEEDELALFFDLVTSVK